MEFTRAVYRATDYYFGESLSRSICDHAEKRLCDMNHPPVRFVRVNLFSIMSLSTHRTEGEAAEIRKAWNASDLQKAITCMFRSFVRLATTDRIIGTENRVNAECAAN